MHHLKGTGKGVECPPPAPAVPSTITCSTIIHHIQHCPILPHTLTTQTHTTQLHIHFTRHTWGSQTDDELSCKLQRTYIKATWHTTSCVAKIPQACNTKQDLVGAFTTISKAPAVLSTNLPMTRTQHLQGGANSSSLQFVPQPREIPLICAATLHTNI
jgi:hypothetical protein